MERTNGVKCSQCRAGASTLACWWCRDALHYHGQSSAEKGSDLHAFSQHTLLQHAPTTLEPTVKRLFRKRSIYTVSRLAARVKKNPANIQRKGTRALCVVATHEPLLSSGNRIFSRAHECCMNTFAAFWLCKQKVQHYCIITSAHVQHQPVTRLLTLGLSGHGKVCNFKGAKKVITLLSTWWLFNRYLWNDSAAPAWCNSSQV